jgi:DnaJ-class molecular chaperone
MIMAKEIIGYAKYYCHKCKGKGCKKQYKREKEKIEECKHCNGKGYIKIENK